MKRVSIAVATLGASLMLATAALAQAQTVATPGVTAPGATAAGAAGASGAQQPASLSNVITAIRRAGMGPGGFLQLCDDPLDPRALTNECSAAGIAQ